MRQFKVERLEDQLQSLRRFSPAVIGSVLSSAEGLPIAADLPAGAGDEEQIAARSTAMMSIGDRIADELQRGTLDQLFIHGSAGYVVVVAITRDAALTVLYGQEVRMAMALLEIEYAVKQLRELL